MRISKRRFIKYIFPISFPRQLVLELLNREFKGKFFYVAVKLFEAKMKKAFLVLFCLALLSEAAFSQSLSFGPQLGFFKSKDQTSPSTMPGGAIRLYLGGIGIEGSIYYKKDEYKYSYMGSSSTITTETYPINLTALFRVISILHAEAGIGWYNTKIDYSKLSTAWASIKEETKGEFAYHLGGGAELPFGSFILTGDVRYVFYKLDMSELSNPETLKSDFYVIMVGVMLKL